MWWQVLCYGCLLVVMSLPSCALPSTTTTSTSTSRSSNSSSNTLVVTESDYKNIANMFMFANLTEDYLRNGLTSVRENNGIFSQAQAIHGYLRKLVGSNCILIQRGEVPPYYSCVGCVIEEGMGCVQDMRLNRSGNVHVKCKMSSASEKYAHECCPKVDKDLQYRGAAYPMALQCLQQVGCADTTLYSQLLDECKSTCNYDDPRSKGAPICLASFNSAPMNNRINWILSITTMVSAMVYLIMMT